MHKRLLIVSGLVCGLIGSAQAWWPAGHSIITEGAVQALPADMPKFFRTEAAAIAHCAQDPDIFKNRSTAQLTDAEASEHYLDLEELGSASLPANRYDFIKLCYDQKLDPRKVGLLPYAVMEWTQRLTLAFAEHRRWPENPYIRQKCLVYAGVLSHYAGDLCMPLHTTIHHDGRALPDGESPRSGIHKKVDALIERLKMTPSGLAEGQKISAFKDLWPAIQNELARSHERVDEVYRLESQLPSTTGPMPTAVSPEVTAFTLERGQAATRFTADLFLTAWQQSAKVRLPEWLVREQPGATTAPVPATQPVSPNNE